MLPSNLSDHAKARREQAATIPGQQPSSSTLRSYYPRKAKGDGAASSPLVPDPSTGSVNEKAEHLNGNLDDGERQDRVHPQPQLPPQAQLPLPQLAAPAFQPLNMPAINPDGWAVPKLDMSNYVRIGNSIYESSAFGGPAFKEQLKKANEAEEEERLSLAGPADEIDGQDGSVLEQMDSVDEVVDEDHTAAKTLSSTPKPADPSQLKDPQPQQPSHESLMQLYEITPNGSPVCICHSITKVPYKFNPEVARYLLKCKIEGCGRFVVGKKINGVVTYYHDDDNDQDYVDFMLAHGKLEYFDMLQFLVR